MKKKSIIPPGCFCYRIKRIQGDEKLNDNIDRFGKDLREFRYHGEYKEILCPYWRLTDYGTVIRLFQGEINTTKAGRFHYHFQNAY
jgi:hypothetical protein